MGFSLYVESLYLLLFLSPPAFFLIILNFCNLILCLGVLLFAFILSGYLWASWTWISVSFPRLGKFSALFLQIIFLIISLFFFVQDSYNANIVPLMLSHWSLIKLYLLLKFFFHFAAVWISFIVLFSSCLIHSSLYPIYCWMLLLHFSVSS